MTAADRGGVEPSTVVLEAAEEAARDTRVGRLVVPLLAVADNDTFAEDKGIVRAVALRWIAIAVEAEYLSPAMVVRDVRDILAATDRATAALVGRHGDRATLPRPLLAGPAVTP